MISSQTPPPGEPVANGSAPGRNGRLDSWKEIAAYLRRGGRTVVRWEREERLPVHPQTHQKRGTVYAYADELEAWLASRGREAALREPEESPAAPSRSERQWRFRLALSAAVLLLLAGAAWVLIPRYLRPGAVTLAILPFVNEDGDASLEPLSDGIAEPDAPPLPRCRTVSRSGGS